MDTAVPEPASCSGRCPSGTTSLRFARQRLRDIRDRLEEVGATCERNERRAADLTNRVEDALVAVSHAGAAVEQQCRTVGRAERRLREAADAAATLQALSSARVIELYRRGAIAQATAGKGVTPLTGPTTRRSGDHQPAITWPHTRRLAVRRTGAADVR